MRWRDHNMLLVATGAAILFLLLKLLFLPASLLSAGASLGLCDLPVSTGGVSFGVAGFGLLALDFVLSALAGLAVYSIGLFSKVFEFLQSQPSGKSVQQSAQSIVDEYIRATALRDDGAKKILEAKIRWDYLKSDVADAVEAGEFGKAENLLGEMKGDYKLLQGKEVNA